MVKRYKVLIILLLTLFSSVFANQGGKDNFGYMWTDSKNTGQTIGYQWLDIRDGTSVFTTQYDDTLAGPFTIPFNFEFYGRQVSQFYISSNGFISFTQLTSSYPANDTIPSTNLPDSIIAPYWDDLKGASSRNAYYDTLGSAPNRKLVVMWDNFEQANVVGSRITFELILFEHSNLIKIQYNLASTSPADSTDGGSATIGIKAGSDGLLYSYNQSGSIKPFLAILFHPKTLGDTVRAAISPTQVSAGQANQPFVYKFYDIDLASQNGLGKLDRVAIASPFATTVPTVTGIKINNYNAFLQNTTSVPSDPGFATWYLDTTGTKDSIVVQTSDFDVVDSLIVYFSQSIPTTLSTGNNYASTYDARLDSTSRKAATGVNWSVDVVGNTVAYYEFSPSTAQSTTAGSGVAFTVTARDIYGNAVTNSDSVVFVASGSSSAVFTPNDTLGFGGLSSVSVTVTDTVSGSFTVVAQKKGDSGVTGQSGLVTVSSASASDIVKVSGDGTGVVGTDRTLRARLIDAYGNGIGGETLTFTRVGGTGSFSGSVSSTAVTGSDGEGEVIYTLGSDVSQGPEQVEVSYGGLLDTFVVNLTAGSVSYYEFSPSTAQSTTAGSGVAFTVTARDFYGNAVSNSDTVLFTAFGSSTAQFTPNDTLVFNTGTQVSVIVTDTVSGSFRVKAQKKNNSYIVGESGIVTVSHAAPYTLTALSATDTSAIVGQNISVRVKLTDVYQNAIADSAVNFERVSGSGTFIDTGTGQVSKTTSASGVATAIYQVTVSTDSVADTLRVRYGSLTPVTVAITLLPDSISYYTLVDANALYQYQAGDTISLQVTAYDVYNNVVTTSNRVVTLDSSKTGLEVISQNPIALSSGVASFTVRDTVKQNGLSFEISDSYGKSAVSNPFTISPDSLYRLQIRTLSNNNGVAFSSHDTTLTTDQTLTLYAAGFDRFGNYVSDIDSSGWSTSGGLEPVLVNTPGSSVSYSPSKSGVTGRIKVTIPGTPGILSDSTGTITVNDGSPASLQILLSRNGTALQDTTLTASDTLRLYAGLYDSDGNYIEALPAASWTISPDSLGQFENGNSTITDSIVVFTAAKAGNGTIQITYSGLSDVSGLITVQKGSANSIVIRTQPHGQGSPYSTTPVNMTTDQSITLYAAHYDIMGNYVGDLAVNWDKIDISGNGLVGVPTGPSAQITFDPTLPGTGKIYTTSATLQNDTTALISVLSGSINYVEIQNSSGSGGNAIDTLTLTAGDSLKLFASAYDQDGNFLGDTLSTWSIAGDSIGLFKYNPSDTNVFRARTTGNALIKAVNSPEGLVDMTSNIRVLSGLPHQLFKVSESDSQQGSVAQQLPLPIRVLVKDAYDNPVPNIMVGWLPKKGGTASQDSSQTNSQGIAQTYWTLHDTTTVDTLAAYVTKYSTIPNDTVYFTAFPQPASDMSMAAYSATSFSGTILDTVGPIQVQIRDSLSNTVQGVEVSFAITDRPAGSIGEKLTTYSTTTNTQGIAQTNLILGSKLGTYTVTAFANTQPNSVLFTGEAVRPGAADSIIITAGNNQSGVVGRALTDSIRVKLVDAYLNPLPDSTLIFETINGGNVNPTSATTDSNGIVATEWTPGTVVGNYYLRVRTPSSSVVSDTLVASASREKAYTLSLVSIRNIPHDSVSAVVNGSVPFQVQVTDKYGNVVPDTLISCEVVQGNNAQIGNYICRTNADGKIINSVIIDDSLDLTIVRSFIPNVDSVNIHIYRIHYKSNTMSPPAIAVGGNTALSLQVINPGPYPVKIDSNQSYIYFTDGTKYYRATGSTDSIPGSTTGWTLDFDSAFVDSTFIAANYQPEIFIRGAAEDSLISGSFFADPNALRVYNVAITAVTVDSPATSILRRGDKMIVQMQIRNDGNLKIVVDSAATTPVIKQSGVIVPATFQWISGNDTIAPNTSVFLKFRYQIPSNFGLDTYQLDGIFQGTVLLTGALVEDSDAAFPDTFTVISAATALYQSGSLSPQQVNSSDSAQFTLIIQNSGDANVLLKATETFLTFGSDSFYLDGNQNLSGNSLNTLTFASGIIQSVPSATPYPVTLYLSGEEVGASFRDTLSLSDAVLVNALPVVEISNFAIDSLAASQGEANIPLSFDIRNVGSLNDTIRINSPDDLVLHNASGATFIATLVTPGSGQFPLIITANQSQTFNYKLEFPESYPAGRDTFRVEATYRDDNTLRSHTLSSTTFNESDDILILAKSNLVITSLQPVGNDTVSQGQSGVLIRMKLKNTGQVSAQLDTATVSFLNQHTFASTPLFPKTISAGATDSLDFEITVNPSAALGADPISGVLNYTDVRSQLQYQSNFAAQDSLYIQSFNPSLIRINSVVIDPYYVNQSQQNISTQVKINNDGQASIRIDSLSLIFSPHSLEQTLLETLPVTIAGGQSHTFSLYISVSDTSSTGLYGIDAQIRYTDLNSLTQYVKSGAENADSLFVQVPADLFLSAVQVDEDTVSAGKTGLTVSFQIINTGEAEAQITQTLPQITPTTNDISLTRLSPATLPILQGGDTTNFVYRADAGDSTGSFVIDFSATGTDLNDSRTLGPVSSASPFTLTIRNPGTIVIDSVRVSPDLVTLGQSNILGTVYFRNSGQMPVTVNDVDLTFNGSYTGFAQDPLDTTGFNLSGGESLTRQFSITVLSNAPTGQVVVSALASGIEQNLQQSLSVSALQKDTMVVQGGSQLRILSVSSQYDSVSRGQSGIQAQVKLRNDGETTALLDTLELRFSRGTFSNTITVFTPAQTLKPDSVIRVDFTNISVGGSSLLGLVTVNAHLAARDSVSGEVLSVENADTTHSWRVVTPGDLQALALIPDRITTGQNVSFVLQVRNLGQANMYLLSGTSQLNIGSVSLPLPDTSLVAGNQQRNLSFNSTIISLPVGKYAVTFDMDYIENLASYSTTINVPDSVQVDDRVALDTTSTVYPQVISQEMVLPIEITLQNGNGSATALIDSIKIPQLNYQVTRSVSLAGGQSRIDTLQPYITSAFLGVQNLTVQYYWRDANSGSNGTSVFNLRPITVLKQAQLSVLDITGPDTVFAGQTNRVLQVSVNNSGEVTAEIDTLIITKEIGLYQISTLTTYNRIPGGETRNFEFSLDIDSSSATGTDNFGAIVVGRDSLNQNAQSDTAQNLHSWVIFEQARAEILSVTSPNIKISRGQKNIPVTVKVRNASDRQLAIDSLLLYSRVLSDNNYQYSPQFTPPVILTANQTQNFSFLVNVNSLAALGRDTIDARLVARAYFSGDTVDVQAAASNAPHSWLVQKRPPLQVQSIQIDADRMSLGQDYVSVLAEVKNTQAGDTVAQARLDSVLLLANDVNATIHFDTLLQSTFPITILPGQQTAVNYEIKPGPGAVPGTYRFKGRLYYTDLNDDSTFVVTSSELDTVILETPAQFDFLTIIPSQDTTHWGKQNDSLYVRIINSGQATADVNGSSILIEGTTEPIQTFQTSPTLPLQLPGGDSLLLSYVVNYPASPGFDTTVHYRAVVTGEDINSGFTVVDSSAFTAAVKIQTPPALSYVPFSLSPDRVDTVTTGVVFRLKIYTSGNSAIDLDSSNTKFSISQQVTTLLDSPLVILGGDTTTLRFRPVDITLSDGNYITQVRLVGTYHRDSFDQDIITGNLKIGGALTISSLIFPGLPTNPVLSLGDTNITVQMDVRNFTGDTLQIDTAETGLRFRFSQDSSIVSSLFNPVRIDVNELLYPQSTTSLEFRFDVPVSNIDLGDYWIQGLVQAKKGAIVDTARTSLNGAVFTVISGAELSYVSNSLQPAFGIPTQDLLLRVNLANTGQASVQLNANRSYLKLKQSNWMPIMCWPAKTPALWLFYPPSSRLILLMAPMI